MQLASLPEQIDPAVQSRADGVGKKSEKRTMRKDTGKRKREVAQERKEEG